MPKKATKDRKRLLANLAQVNEELEHLRNMMQGEVDVELDEGDTEIVEREKTAALIAVLDDPAHRRAWRFAIEALEELDAPVT